MPMTKYAQSLILRRAPAIYTSSPHDLPGLWAAGSIR